MNYDDLSFDVVNDDGIEVQCDILSIVPNDDNKNEPYVVYTDYMLDENDEFVLQFGKVIEDNGEYQLQRVTEKDAIMKIREQLTDDIVSYVNKKIQDNLHE